VTPAVTAPPTETTNPNPPSEEEPLPDNTQDTPQSEEVTQTVTVPQSDNQVLGAKRTQLSASQGAVLGAQRGLDCAVLGKRRRPSTGDSSALLIWLLTTAVAFGGILTSAVMLISNKKDRCRKKK
jgi:hypothetical protein